MRAYVHTTNNRGGRQPPSRCPAIQLPMLALHTDVPGFAASQGGSVLNCPAGGRPALRSQPSPRRRLVTKMLVDQGLAHALTTIVGPGHVIVPGPDQAPYIVDWHGRYRSQALAVVEAAVTAEVAEVVQLCARYGVAVAPQGGNTGMCGAATSMRGGPWWCGWTGCAASWKCTRWPASSRSRPAAPCGDAGSRFRRWTDIPAQPGRRGQTNAGGTAALRCGPTRNLVIKGCVPPPFSLRRTVRLRPEDRTAVPQPFGQNCSCGAPHRWSAP